MNQRLLMTCFLTTLFLSPSIFAAKKTIYGQDGRQDIDLFVGSMLRSKAESVAGMVAKAKLKSKGNSYRFESQQLTDFGMCSTVNFAQQNLLPDCTGFMVGEDLLMTAGHCIESYKDCADFVWVFGYDQKVAQKNEIAKDQVFKCKRIVKREYYPDHGIDYSLIQLQRSPSLAKHPPLKLASQEFTLGDNLAMIGHPSSLPLKITTGGNVVKVLDHSVRVSLDAFGGNSGSPIFDRHTGELLGMLTGGGTDFVDQNGCKVEYKCPGTSTSDECGGEDVFKISYANLPQLLAAHNDSDVLSDAIVEEDAELVDYFLQQGAPVNASVYGWSPLMIAVMQKDIELVKLLIDAGAEQNQVEAFDQGNALIIAISLEQEEIAQLLLENGAYLDQVTKEKQETALTMAIQKEMIELAQALIEAGARTDLKTKDGYTASDFADFIGSSELLELLEE